MAQEPNELAVRPIDRLTSLFRGAVGAIPVAGPLLAEIAGTVIPNQRIDRLTEFARELSRRIGDVEDGVLRAQIDSEEFTELVEESLHQAVRSTSEQRRAYIASILANGIKQDDIDYIEAKHLLRLLGELNDVEVIWLRAYYEWHWGGRGDSEFLDTHADVLTAITPTMGSSQEELDKAALQESYRTHMERLGLIRARIRYDRKTKTPEFDSKGGFKTSGHEITPLGQLLVRYIDTRPAADCEPED